MADEIPDRLLGYLHLWRLFRRIDDGLDSMEMVVSDPSLPRRYLVFCPFSALWFVPKGQGGTR